MRSYHWCLVLGCRLDKITCISLYWFCFYPYFHNNLWTNNWTSSLAVCPWNNSFKDCPFSYFYELVRDNSKCSDNSSSDRHFRISLSIIFFLWNCFVNIFRDELLLSNIDKRIIIRINLIKTKMMGVILWMKIYFMFINFIKSLIM